MSANKSNAPHASEPASQGSSSPPQAASPSSTPSKGSAPESATMPKTPGSTPRHRRNRAHVSNIDVSEAGLTIAKARPEDTGSKNSDDDVDDVFFGKAIKTANQRSNLLSGYDLNVVEMGGPQHGIAVCDFAYEPRSGN